jgi:phenylpyruvate tautomerase PptA (4-oxalocrotonate tautomerase family)
MTTADVLDGAKRSAIASAISKAHSDATGAPPFFVQVIFEEAKPGHRFLGGSQINDHVWIRGDIRAGRILEVRKSLMLSIMKDISKIMGLMETQVWVYLNSLEPTDMVEYGHVLPAPGEEKVWFEALPQSLKDYLLSLGTKQDNFDL